MHLDGVAHAAFGPDERLLSDTTGQEPGRVAVFVNFRGVGDDIQGEKHKDAQNFTRVGFLTITSNSGPDRIFHAVRGDVGRTLYYRLENRSGTEVTYAFSTEHSTCIEFLCEDLRGLNPKTWGPLPPPWALAG